jgi:hypothetical protein
MLRQGGGRRPWFTCVAGCAEMAPPECSHEVLDECIFSPQFGQQKQQGGNHYGPASCLGQLKSSTGDAGTFERPDVICDTDLFTRVLLKDLVTFTEWHVHAGAVQLKAPPRYS